MAGYAKVLDDKIILEYAVSWTAFCAQILDTPTFDSGLRSCWVYTSIPYLTSAWRMHVVLQYDADELATAATNELIKISFVPVADLVMPAVSFLKVIATAKDEVTAAP